MAQERGERDIEVNALIIVSKCSNTTVKSLLLINWPKWSKKKENRMDRRTRSTQPPPSYDLDIANLPPTSHTAGY